MCLLLFLTCLHGGHSQPWFGDSVDQLDTLCESDHDNVGQHLGCSCNRYVDNDIMLKADCSSKWIGYNNSLLLPPKLNISRRVRIVDFTKNELASIDMNTFGSCEFVQILLLGENKISSFEGVNCPLLLKLDLSRNKLKNLTTDALVNLPHLAELDLSHNELIFLESSTIEQLKHLRVLNLGMKKVVFR